MARLILKCRYIKSGVKHSKNLIKYIATRDGVEISNEPQEDKKATQAQIGLINEIIVEIPETVESVEYKEYLNNPNKETASRFISYAIDENIELIDVLENYVEYIAKRPRAEKLGAHGLFSDSDTPINLSEIAREVSQHDGIVWTNIVSIQREDAARLNYDNANAWQDLIRSQAATMAEAMKIPLQDLRWYAAFHNESHHPHVHIVAYSVGREPYMTEKGILKMKSAFANEIFKQDLIQIYEKQTAYRSSTVNKSCDIISEIIRQINMDGYENKIVELMFQKLSEQLTDHKGKKVYGYLSRTAKKLVNGIVDELEKDKRISSIYDLWYEQRNEILKTYTDTPQDRVPLSQNKEFRSIKNAVIKEALNIAQNTVTFEDDNFESDETISDTSDEQGDPADKPITNKKSRNMYSLYKEAKKHLDKKTEIYDPVLAVELLKRSADMGYDIAMYRLGKMYLLGDDVPKDTETALRWLWKAVEQKNMYAMYQLGKMYLYGQLVDKNTELGIALLTDTNEKGYQFAKCLLDSYNSGNTLAPSALAAFRLFTQIARIFRESTTLQNGSSKAVDKKLRQKTNDKKLAQGVKLE